MRNNIPTIQREVRKRSVIGKLFKWIFFAFNLLMVFWIIAYWVKLSDMSQSIVTDAEKTGAAVGGTIVLSSVNILAKSVLPAIALLSWTCTSQADSMRIARELGTILASESACQMTLDQDAIAKFIEQKVKADDMAFPSTLNMMTSGSEYQIAEMSASSRAAHCVQVKRVAKANGFIQ